MADEQEQEQQQQEEQKQEAAPEVEEGAEAKAEETVEKKEEAAPEVKEEPAGEVTTVTIGDAQPVEEDKTPAPGWVKEVRQRNRELEKQNRELQKQLQQGQQQSVTVGKKPEMSDPDIDYDSAKYEAAYAAWMGRKTKADAEQAKIEEQHKAEQTAFQGKLDAYGTAKAALKVADAEDAEAMVREALNERQQAIIIKAAKNPALLVYALGKNPAKLQELAKVTDLVEFAVLIGEIGGQLKVTTKKPTPPAPEKKVTGAAPGGGMDNTLDKLRAEAEKSGDYTKVVAYKQQKKAA